MVTSPSTEFFRSQFENVLQIFPQGHDKALKQAFYSTAATLFVVLACCAAVAVYHILLPFVRPLMWAILCGTVLFPLKYQLVMLSRSWLQSLRQKHTPLIVGTVLMPMSVINGISTSVISVFEKYLVPVVVGCVVTPVAYLVIYVWIGRAFMDTLLATFYLVYDTLGFFRAFWVLTLVGGYVLSVVFLWNPTRNVLFKVISVPVWLALLFHLATIVGPFRVPLAVAIVSLLVISLVSGIRDIYLRAANGESEANWLSNLLSARNESPTLQTSTGSELCTPTGGEAVENTNPPTNVDEELPKACCTEAKLADMSSANNASDNSEVVEQSLQEKASQPHTPVKRPDQHLQSSFGKAKKNLGDYCLLWVIFALVVVHLWLYKVFLLVFPALVVCWLVRRFDECVGCWMWIQQKFNAKYSSLKQMLSGDPRCEVILPHSIRRLGCWLSHGDDKVIQALDNAMDKVVTVFIIFLLIVSVVLVALFAALEIHRESVHLVQLSSNLMNKTVHPELAQWLPDEDFFTSTVDSFVDNAYIYGREWISNKLHEFLSGDDVSKEQVEKQVLKIWDKIYDHLIAKNKTNAGSSLQRQLSLDLNIGDISNVSDVISKLHMFNLDIIGLAQENIGVFMSLIETLWSVLVGNVALLINVIVTVLSLILGGGTAILNIVLQVVVFLTTLFYLLSSSSSCYKPVEMFVGFSPISGFTNGMSFGKAFEDAIGSVFLASIKLALFYGLYTWLTHLMFGVEIIFIPSILAAVLAAVPFLGTYMAAIPAVIDLWLVNGRHVEAIILFVAHYLPTLFVDTAMYSQIKGGHPYMTGLAIAGGIYWMGLEGAIVGPTLLCCLVVAVNMYQNMLKPDITKSASETAFEKRVKFNLKRGVSSDV